MDYALGVEDIMKILPHRPPMLLVDRLLELEPGVRAVGMKTVTINEPFFVGHFPGMPIMPGVLIMEAMAQVAGVMMLSLPQYKDHLPFIGGMDNVRFRRMVVPGDTLITESTLVKVRGLIGKVRMVARVNGEIAAECDMTFAIRPVAVPSDVRATLREMEIERRRETHDTGGQADA